VAWRSALLHLQGAAASKTSKEKNLGTDFALVWRGPLAQALGAAIAASTKRALARRLGDATRKNNTLDATLTTRVPWPSALPL